MSNALCLTRMFTARLLGVVVAMALLSGSLLSAIELSKPDETPELDDILYIIRQDEAPRGVVLHTREYDESAYYWVAPRLEYYVSLIREKYPEIPLVIISHGDEIRSLTISSRPTNQEVHRIIRRLVEEYLVDFQICGAFATMNNLEHTAFPPYVNVVPSAPSALADYRDQGYELISIELTW